MTLRTLDQLINTAEPAWPEVQRWIGEAGARAEILSTVRARGEETLLALQVTTRSPMGALALETGGLLIDRGWLRVLGAGCERMKESLASWNALGGVEPPESPGFLIVAHDVAGGFFAINGGALPAAPGNVLYFAPDTLEWEDTGNGYSQFLRWSLMGDLEKYYESVRWSGWQQEIASLDGDHGIHFYPPLWSAESKQSAPSRKAVPMRELWGLYGPGAPQR